MSKHLNWCVLFSVRRFLSIGLCCSALLFSNASLADHGEKFLSIRCNPKVGTFEVEPRIIWNEEFDALSSDIEQSNGNIKRGDTLLIQFSLNPPAQQLTGNLDAKCTISGLHLKATVHGWDFPQLELFSENKQISAIAIENVWLFAGDLFRVRYTSAGGWEELCGDEGAENSWHALDRKRTSTNCPAQPK